ncbi:biotin transporter BioY [Comamonas sp. BIGb0152]|uniref:biotin transporter BioY n=1 Tax=Comamonas sp. BIGb0152 TaxID=2940601 RepID=UPI00216A2CBE|nr:biotin transporter BioY [Comamonas sp. BIGb0152]
MTTEHHTETRAQRIAMVALFAALLAAFGLIPKIDLPLGVPITAQTTGVMLAGCMLGARMGFQAMVLFLAAVALGLPLLSGGRGGMGVFFLPSAGYLISYPVAAAVAGLVMRALAGKESSPARLAACAFAASVVGGIVVVHAFGVVGLMLLAKLSFVQAAIGTLVFVPGDLVKCVLVALIVHTVARGLPDWRFGGRRL